MKISRNERKTTICLEA